MRDDTLVGEAQRVRPALAQAVAPSAADAAVAHPGRDRGPSWRGKRLADIVLASVLLVLALPVLVVVALLVGLTSPGPILFRQRRVGLGGAEFPMLKFRTMHVGAEARLRSDLALHTLFLQGGHKIPSHLDPRLTAVGKVLRRLSFDELPQLFNVLAGHMSIVGPRPVERTQLVRDYGSLAPKYEALRPGLTGLWQVSGRSTVQFPARAQLDCYYLDTCGPWTDTKIILRTPLVVFTGLGAD